MPVSIVSGRSCSLLASRCRRSAGPAAACRRRDRVHDLRSRRADRARRRHGAAHDRRSHDDHQPGPASAPGQSRHAPRRSSLPRRRRRGSVYVDAQLNGADVNLETTFENGVATTKGIEGATDHRREPSGVAADDSCCRTSCSGSTKRSAAVSSAPRPGPSFERTSSRRRRYPFA